MGKPIHYLCCPICKHGYRLSSKGTSLVKHMAAKTKSYANDTMTSSAYAAAVERFEQSMRVTFNGKIVTFATLKKIQAQLDGKKKD